MGFLSTLFGGSMEDKELRDALALVNRIIDDETFQLEHLNPMIREMIESASAYDSGTVSVKPRTTCGAASSAA